jgi:hypothetical protein
MSFVIFVMLVKILSNLFEPLIFGLLVDNNYANHYENYKRVR